MIALPLARGLVTLVDDQDAERLDGRPLWATRRRNTLYVQLTEGGRSVYLHRWLLEVTDRRVLVDHADGHGLNNTRRNLRRADNVTNRANAPGCGGRSTFKGVFPTGSGRWRAQLTVAGVRRSLGTFATDIEAALAYNEAAFEAHGDFAHLNVIPVALTQVS